MRTVKTGIFLIASMLLNYSLMSYVYSASTQSEIAAHTAASSNISSLPDASGKTLIISTEHTITENAVIPSGTLVRVIKGGSFNIPSGITLNITGPFEAGLYGVFTGQGIVIFGKNSAKEIHPEWWGAKIDGSTDNTLSLVGMIKCINAMGGNCKIVFARGIYGFRPQNHYSKDYEWRKNIEMVDVKNVEITGYGATLKQDIPNTWKIGDPANHGNDEGPVQFRSSVPGGCANIVIKGLTVTGARLTGGRTFDGNSFGIAFRAVNGTKTVDVSCNNWSTDGIYFGSAYGDAFKGSSHIIENSLFDSNMRQGASVVGNDHVKFYRCIFSNTGGSSFGHGIDFEPDGPMVQGDMMVTECKFSNNERGALNFIRTSNATVSKCEILELRTNGAIYIDGGQSAATICDNIRIISNAIVTNKAALYVLGSYIHNVEFNNNSVKTMEMPNNLATIRVNFQGTAKDLRNFTIMNNTFEGTGGILANTDGDFIVENNTFSVSKQNSSSADVFAISSDVKTNFIFRNNIIIVNSDVFFRGAKDIYIPTGEFVGNNLSSHESAIYTITDKDGRRTLSIGNNEFSQYFYYKGEKNDLDIKYPGFPHH